jgi:hypothetical protein
MELVWYIEIIRYVVYLAFLLSGGALNGTLCKYAKIVFITIPNINNILNEEEKGENIFITCG